MEGQIGVLYQEGKQIGGVFDWQYSIALEPMPKKNWTDWKAGSPNITALSYWLLRKPDSPIFQADLFQFIRGHLALVDSSIVEIKFPDFTLNKKLLGPVKMIWTKSLSF